MNTHTAPILSVLALVSLRAPINPSDPAQCYSVTLTGSEIANLRAVLARASAPNSEPESAPTCGTWFFSKEDQGRVIVRADITGLPFVAECSRRDAPLIASAPRLLRNLIGARSALRKALPFCPADAEAHHVGEVIDDLNAALDRAGIPRDHIANPIRTLRPV